MKSIPVMVAAKDELFRTGLLAMLSGSRAVQVVGEAADTGTALKLIKKLKPSVLLLDIGLAGQQTFGLVAELGESLPDTRCVLTSVLENQTYLARAHAAGGANCLFADFTQEELVMAIKTAHAGDKPTSGRFAEVASAMKVQEPRSAPAGTLSPRQAQVLNLISYGLSNEEISRTIGIEILTAKEHVSNVLKRLNVPSRLQAAVWAINPQVISEQRSRRTKATPEMTP